MTVKPEAQAASRPLFVPSRRAVVALAILGLTALGIALFLRYGIIQNTPIGLACEAGEDSLTCKLRLVVIIMFVNECFGWTAVIAAGVQLWRPNSIALVISLVFALLGLVLYNTRASALAVTLLVLSFARGAPARG